MGGVLLRTSVPATACRFVLASALVRMRKQRGREIHVTLSETPPTALAWMNTAAHTLHEDHTAPRTELKSLYALRGCPRTSGAQQMGIVRYPHISPADDATKNNIDLIDLTQRLLDCPPSFHVGRMISLVSCSFKPEKRSPLLIWSFLSLLKDFTQRPSLWWPSGGPKIFSGAT